MSTDEEIGATLRSARLYIGLSLTQMADATHYTKGYLGLVETGLKPATMEVVAAYEDVLGDGMRRRDIKHPRLIKIRDKDHLRQVTAAVESGDPDIFAQGPTSSSIDAAVAPRIGTAGVQHFRRWIQEGKTSTLRANAVSILGFLPGRENAELVVKVLEEDDKVRRLCLASEVSRLTQVEWELALQAVEDPSVVPHPERLAKKLAREAIDPKDTESRWCGAYLLRKLAPVIGR